MVKLLRSYSSVLSIPQIAEGMNIATKNASRLAADARYLLERERYPSAASMAALSIEESGKVVILRRFLTVTDKKELRALWKEYRTHTQKNLNWILPDLVSKGARKLDDFREMVDPESDHPELLNSIKQLGFYTDCLGDAHWSDPTVVIGPDLAKSLVTTAEVLAPDRDISVKELELWDKHMKPVWGKDYEWMRQALSNWYAEMQEAGLVPEGENKMDRFLKFGFTASESKVLDPDA